MHRPSAAQSYAAAAAIGICAAFAILPLATIAGTGALWTNIGNDTAENLTGHLAYQAAGWHWPILLAPTLAWPDGRSIVLTDSNPLFSIAAKLITTFTGGQLNLFGVWLLLCWVLQPVAALYALRGFQPAPRQPSWEATLAAACLSLLCPAWLIRHHVNLLGHFSCSPRSASPCA